MRILLDESAPRRLKRLFSDHDVETAQERGWARKRNGELLRLAVEAGFEVFVTPDTNLAFQQPLASFDIAAVVLASGDNRMAAYEPMAARLRDVVLSARKGEALVVTG